jgi:hypothetical protein
MIILNFLFFFHFILLIIYIIFIDIDELYLMALVNEEVELLVEINFCGAFGGRMDIR